MEELAEKERLANRLQSLLDLLPGGVIVIDAHGVVREANPAALGLLGEPLVGMLWREVIARCFARARMTATRFPCATDVACPSPPAR